MSNWKQWINDYKQENNEFLYHNDEEVYRRLAVKNLVPSEYRVPELDNKFGISAEESAQTQAPTQQSKPQSISFFSEIMNKFGDSIPEDEWYSSTLKAAHAKSMAGMASDLEAGEVKFDLDKMRENGEIGTVEEIASTFLAMTSPLDAATLLLGGKLGKTLADARITNLIRKSNKKYGKKFQEKLAEKGTKAFSLKDRMIDAQIRSGVGVGSYMFSKGYLDARLKGENPYLAGAKELGTGFLLYGGLSGLSVGLLSRLRSSFMPNFSKMTYDQRMNTPFSERAKWKLLGKPAEIATSSTLFTAGTTLQDVVNGNDVSMQSIGNNWAQSVGLFTILNSKSFLPSIEKLKQKTKDLKNSYKGKKNNAEASAAQKAEESFVSKTSGQKQSDVMLRAIDELKATRTIASNKFSKINKDLDDVISRIDKNLNIIKNNKESKKGLEAASEFIDIQAITNKLKEDISDIKFVQGSVDHANQSAAEEKFKLAVDDYNVAVEKNLDDKFKTYFDEIENAGSIAMKLTDMQVTDVMVGKKKVPIFDRSGNLQVGYESLKKRLDEYVTPVETLDATSGLQVLGKKQYLQSAKQEYDRLEDKGRFERKEDLSELLDIKPSVKLKAVPNKNFKKNAAFTQYMIQNIYPTQKAEGGARVGKVIDIETIKDYVKNINKFSEYLSDNIITKNFNTMTVGDVTAYLSANPTHGTAISNLIKNMKSAGVPINKDLAAIPTKQVASLGEKIATRKQKQMQIGARVKSVTEEEGFVSRVQSKANVPKFTPITKRLQTLIKKNIQDNEKIKLGLSRPEDFIFTDTKNGNIYTDDINAIVNHFAGSKVTPGGSKSIATAFRKVLGEYADSYDTRENTNYYLAVDRLGLGHLSTADVKEIIKMRGTYGKGEAQAIKDYQFIVKKMLEDIKSPKEYQKYEDPQRYTISEISEIFKSVQKMKPSETLTLEITGNKKDNAKIYRTYSKNMIEGLFRYILEVPSRLNEIVLPNIKRTDLRTNIKETDKQYLRILKGKEKTGQLSSKVSERPKQVQSSLENINKMQSNIKENAKIDPYRDEKLKLNKSIKATEKLLLKSKNFTKLDRDRLRRQSFGASNYKISNNFDVNSFKSYANKLKNIKSEIDNPSNMDIYISKKLIPNNITEKLTKALDVKSGNPNDLSPVGKEIFKQLTDDYSPPQTFSSAPEQIAFRDSGNDDLYLLQSGKLNTNDINANIKKASTTAWVLIKNIADKSKGSIKKYPQDLQQISTDYYLYFNELHGQGNVARDNLKDHIKNNNKLFSKKKFYKDVTWMDARLMENVIKNLKKLKKEEKPDLEIIAEYQKIYDRNIKPYNNSKIEGTWEYESLLMKKDYFDKRFAEALKLIKKNHEPIKGTKLYDDIVGGFEKMYEKDYFPNMAKFQEHLSLFSSSKAEQQINKAVDKSIDEKIHKELIAKPAFKKLKGVKVDRRMDNKKYADAYNKIKDEKYFKDGAAYNEISIKETVKMQDSYFVNENGVNSTNFMARGDMFNYFERVPVREKLSGKIKYKIQQVYETNLINVYNRYNDSSSRFMATMKYAPEYLKSNMHYQRTGKLNTALTEIKKYEGKKLFNQTTYDYLQKTIEQRLLGINEVKSNPTIRSIGGFVSSTGMSAMGFPGARNFMFGQAQTILNHDLKFYTKAFYNLSQRTSREMMRLNAKKLGAIGYTRKELSGMQTMNKVNEQMYVLSLQSSAENINRIIDIEATKLQFTFMAQELNSGKMSPKEEKRFEDWLKNTARFTDKDYNLIKSGKVFEESDEGLIAYNHLLNKSMFYVNLATQGGVGALDNPLWMSNPKYKYMLTFLRIPRSVLTHYHQQAIKPLFEKGNFSPMTKFIAASIFLNEILEKSEKKSLSKEEITKYDSWFGTVMHRSMQAEIFQMYGMALDLVPGLNPYYKDPGSPLYFMLNQAPASAQFSLDAINLGANLSKSAFDIVFGNNAAGLKRLQTAPADFFKRNISLYSQQQDAFRRGRWARVMGLEPRLGKEKTKNYDEFKDVQVIVSGFKRKLERERGFPISVPDNSKLYYTSLKKNLFFGSNKEIIESVFDAYNNELYEQIQNATSELTGKYSQKMANDAALNIMSSVRMMNPAKFSSENSGREKSTQKAFREYVDTTFTKEDKTKINKVYNKSKYYERTVKNILENPQNIKKYVKDEFIRFQNTTPKLPKIKN